MRRIAVCLIITTLCLTALCGYLGWIWQQVPGDGLSGKTTVIASTQTAETTAVSEASVPTPKPSPTFVLYTFDEDRYAEEAFGVLLCMSVDWSLIGELMGDPRAETWPPARSWVNDLNFYLEDLANCDENFEAKDSEPTRALTAYVEKAIECSAKAAELTGLAVADPLALDLNEHKQALDCTAAAIEAGLEAYRNYAATQ